LTPYQSNDAEPVAANTIAFAWSTVIPAQAFAPPESVEPAGHVSAPNSPACGMVWNIHRSCPVFTSKARMCPGVPGSVSGTLLPKMMTSSKIAPGVEALTVARSTGRPRPSRRSIRPSEPKAGRGLPVSRSSA